MRTSIALLAFVLSLAVAAIAQPRPAFIVVVHLANPTDQISRAFLRDAYLKRVTRWGDGEPIRPVDLGGEPFARQRFAAEVIGRPIGAVRNYWQQIIFTGRGVPPVELGSDAAVLAYVAGHRGAVGYVSGMAEPRGVKVVSVR